MTMDDSDASMRWTWNSTTSLHISLIGRYNWLDIKERIVRLMEGIELGVNLWVVNQVSLRGIAGRRTMW